VRNVAAYSRLAGIYDEIVVDPCHDRWASFLDDLWSSDPEGVHSVLDLCCGTGLLGAELIAQGRRVVGVDASEAMLAVARERLGPEVVLAHVTLPDLKVEGLFDAAICTFDGFNYLTPGELRLTLAAIAHHLRPAGWLVFDLHADAMLDFTVSNPVVAGESAGNDFVISSVVDPDLRTCDTRIELTNPREGDPFCEHHRQYFHTDAEVRASLEDAGFSVTAVCEEYTYRPLDASSLRATWAGRLLSAPPVTLRHPEGVRGPHLLQRENRPE
jgi:SAM-dependent methyltransferase